MNKLSPLYILILAGLTLGYASVELNTARIAYYNERDYERARTACLKGIEKGEINFELYGILSGSEIGLGHWKDAASALARAFTIDSLETRAWMSTRGGEAYYYQGFFFAAREFYDEQLYDEALKYLDYALILKPQDTAPLLLKGAIFHKQGDITEANKVYQKAHEADPDDPDINYLIGKSLFEAKEFEASIEYFKDAIDKYRSAYYKASLVLFSNAEDTSRSLQYDINLLWSEEKFDELDRLVKENLKLDGGFDANKINIERFYKATDDLGRIHYYTGMAYYYLKNDSEALYHLMQTISVNPHDIDALYFAGEILVNSQKYREAAEYFEKATEIKDDDMFAWFYLGVSYMKLKKYREAISAFEDGVLSIDPCHVNSMQNLAYIYREIGDHKKSLKYLQRVEELNE
jgi:tetratricopeptide (TPR) repeat protein